MSRERAVSRIAPGRVFVTHERIGDAENGLEDRYVFYLREGGRECRHPHHVPIARLGLIQAGPGREFVKLCEQPCRDPGEMDGRVLGDVVTNETPFIGRIRAAFPQAFAPEMPADGAAVEIFLGETWHPARFVAADSCGCDADGDDIYWQDYFELENGQTFPEDTRRGWDWAPLWRAAA